MDKLETRSDNKLLPKKCTICETFHYPADDSEERICSNCYDGFRGFREDIMTLKRAILYLKQCLHPPFVDSIVHGVDCVKDEHTIIRHARDKDDDTPFNVGVVTYCGRCYSEL